MNFLILNGPNLNLLGKREKSIYGSLSFEGYYTMLEKEFAQCKLSYYQSNIEGEIIDKIHEVGFLFDGIVINAAAYTHTSIAIADAIAAISCPVVEVHISNVHKRESFRHVSMISPQCLGVIAGFGLNSYKLGLQSLISHIDEQLKINDE